MKTQPNNPKSPLFALFCLLALGSFLGPWASLGKWSLAAAPMVLWVLIPFRRHSLIVERLRHLTLLSLAFFIGLYMGRPVKGPAGENDLEFYNCKEYEGIGTIIRPVRTNSYSKKAWVQVLLSKNGSRWEPSPGKVMAYLSLEDNSGVNKHDVIHFQGKMKTLYSQYPSYMEYLRGKGLSHQVYVRQIEKVKEEKGLLAGAYRLQQFTAAALDGLFRDSVHAGLIKAMMLGEKSDLDREVRNDFATAGISHVLAISGMHVGIIFLILDKVLFFLIYLRGGYQAKQVLILFCLIAFMFVSGASPAVVRATLMLSGIILAKITYQRYQSLNIVSLTGILQLLYQPGLIFDLGFQLSYAAVLALIIVYPRWEKSFATNVWWRDALLGWIGVTLVATLATAPLIWMNFGTFPTYFLLTNVLVSLPVSILVWLGFLCVLFSFVPMLNILLAWLCSWLIRGLLGIIEGISALPHAVLAADAALWEGAQLLLIELLLGALLVWWLSGKKIRRLLPRFQFSP